MFGRGSFLSARRFAAIAALPLVIGLTPTVGVAPAVAGADPAGPAGWVSTWTGSAMAPSTLVSSVQTLDNQTVRDIVYTTVGGDQLRIRVSNAFGDRPVTIGGATVARQLRGAQLDASTEHPLTFGGHSSVLLPQGGSALSDPVGFAVPALSTLAVSLYLPQPTGQATYHQSSLQTNYLASGDHTADAGDAAFASTVGTWFFLDAVQVRSSARGAIVALGDSITDGAQSQNDANARWPNFLARDLTDRYGPAAPAVIDEGISGNRVMSDSTCFGINLFARVDRDVLSQPGIRTVVLLEGINDLGFSQEPDTGCFTPNTNIGSGQLISAYQRMIAMAHARGLRILGGTLMPAEGFAYWNAAAEQKRLVVNDWIRTSHAFDGVIDFAALIAYPGHPDLIDPKYDSGDHLHPNDAGYQAMANAAERVLTRR